MWLPITPLTKKEKKMISIVWFIAFLILEFSALILIFGRMHIVGLAKIENNYSLIVKSLKEDIATLNVKINPPVATGKVLYSLLISKKDGSKISYTSSILDDFNDVVLWLENRRSPTYALRFNKGCHLLVKSEIETITIKEDKNESNN